jgi:hypothetical protein
MRIEPRFLGWGIFLILAGAIPLAVRQGWLSVDAVAGAWRFWPLILIGIGVGLILRRTALHFVGGLLVAATFGLMFGSLLAGGASGGLDFGCSSGRTGAAFPSQSGILVGGGSVSLEMSCGEATVTGTPGSVWTLAGSGQAPRVDSAADVVDVRSPNRGFFLGGLGSDIERWEVTLPSDPTLDLEATLNAGTARLVLGGMHLDGFSMTTNAGKATVDLTDATVHSLSYTLNAGAARIALPASSLSGSATVNAGDLGLCVPSGAGLRIDSSSVLASNDFAAHGLVHSGSTWTTPGYDVAAIKIDLSLSANAGSVRLDPTGGCR